MKMMRLMRTPLCRLSVASSIVCLGGACGADPSAREPSPSGAGPADGSNVVIADAQMTQVNDDTGSQALADSVSASGDAASPSADGSSDDSGGAIGMYKSCAPVTLTQQYTGPGNFVLEYPAGWTGAASAANSYAFTAPYSYLPTGSSVPVLGTAYVTTLTGETATDGADVQRFLAQGPSAFPGAVVSWFAIGSNPAIAYWYMEAPAICGECQGPGDPGPDIVHIHVATADGLAIVEIDGYAHADAPDDTFCDIQAIEASLAFQ